VTNQIWWSSLSIVAILSVVPAWALDPSLDVSQYTRTSWSLRDGAFRGYPKSLAQTTDGYLWLGTDSGVVRFDGSRFTVWKPPAGATLPSERVVKLLATRDGSLWIGTVKGLARWKDLKLVHYTELSGHYITTLMEDWNGTVWVGTTATDVGGTAMLCAIHDRAMSCDDRGGGLGRYVISLYEDGRRRLWVGAATGLWQWMPGPPAVHAMRDRFSEIHAVMEDEHGSILVALNRAIERLDGGGFRPDIASAGGRPVKPTALLRDRDGAMWIGTQDQGLIHNHRGRIDRFAHRDGLSGDFVVTMLEDREGNVWIATLNGIDRFRAVAVTTITSAQNLWADTVVSVLAARDGSVWLATLGGLNQWIDGAIARHTVARIPLHRGLASLFEDHRGRLWISSARELLRVEHGTATTILPTAHVHAIVADESENVWISDQERGLVHLRNATVVESIAWSAFGGKNARTLAIDPDDQGVWLGFFQGGLAYVNNGRVGASYTAADGLGEGPVGHLRVDRDRALWIATERGLSRLQGATIATLTTRNGLPCDAVRWTMEDESRALWVRSACGLTRVERSEIDAWTVDPDRMMQLRTYDGSDGVPIQSDISAYSPTVTRAGDGRIWFASYDGAAVIDPRQLPLNRVEPPVHIEQVTADDTIYEPALPTRLPPLVRDLRIDYTALSFTSPEKVRFRYRLEGRDADWIEAGNRRQAFYADLPPRAYRFRVIASNDSGVWNHEGAVWGFSVEPAIHQTTLFRIALILGTLIAGSLLYRIRIARFAAQLNLRFEERLAERTRMARDLHDTLLQGGLSISMQLHLLADEVADHPVRAKFDHLLARLNQVNEEGRQTVYNLRQESVITQDLDVVLTQVAEDLRGQASVKISVVVEGKVQPLHPLIRDEVYRIGREALANTFRHAHATRVDIELGYSRDSLRLVVRDNGCGMAPTRASVGRPGGWGMQGMRERAAHIGATLRLLSAPSAGTEIELLVPGHVAFQQVRRGRWRFVRGWWA
jgi:signal transduction histidine kinase/ligand-binding sensor domain-containing protein